MLEVKEHYKYFRIQDAETWGGLLSLKLLWETIGESRREKLSKVKNDYNNSP